MHMISYYRFFCVITLLIGFSSTGCATPGNSNMECSEWFTETYKMVDSVPVKHRYQKILEQIAKGCKVIPSSLTEAAKNSLKKSVANQKHILINAAAPYFSESCLPDDPNIAASKLLHICLGSDYPQGEFSSITSKIDAASYLYGQALKKEFEKAGVYKKYGKRILLNFFLSNSVLRESE